MLKFLLKSRITMFLLLFQLTHLAALWNKISKFIESVTDTALEGDWWKKSERIGGRQQGQ